MKQQRPVINIRKKDATEEFYGLSFTTTFRACGVNCFIATEQGSKFRICTLHQAWNCVMPSCLRTATFSVDNRLGMPFRNTNEQQQKPYWLYNGVPSLFSTILIGIVQPKAIAVRDECRFPLVCWKGLQPELQDVGICLVLLEDTVALSYGHTL